MAKVFLCLFVSLYSFSAFSTTAQDIQRRNRWRRIQNRELNKTLTQYLITFADNKDFNDCIVTEDSNFRARADYRFDKTYLIKFNCELNGIDSYHYYNYQVEVEISAHPRGYQFQNAQFLYQD